MPISGIDPVNQTYPMSKIQGLQASLQALQDALTAKAPINHNHAISVITGLQDALDAKAFLNHTHAIAAIDELQTALNAKAPLNHTHAIASIDSLQTTLNAKAPLSHTHAIAAIDELQTALNAKAPLNHTHAPEAWQLLTIPSGWSSYSVSTPLPQIRKFFHLIEMKGTIKKATAIATNEVLLTLPTGYRPQETKFFITWSVNGYTRIELSSDGILKVSISGSNFVVGLDIIFGLL